MEPEIVALLRSPRTHEPLRLETSRGRPTLVGTRTGERFLVRRGVAQLLVDDEVTGLNRRYRRLYNWVAPLYDLALRFVSWLIRGRESDLRRQYLSELDLEPGDRLLEVSVGTGTNLSLLPQDLQMVGLDISQSMLARCRRRLRRWHRQAVLILGNAEALPFQDASFDGVLHVGGINAFDDREQALTEMLRVARPGAKVVVVDETAALIERLSWLPFMRRLIERYAERFEPPVALVPPEAAEIESHPIVGGRLYCLTFRRAEAAVHGGLGDQERAPKRVVGR